jgi:hypothetical protein
MDDSQIESRIRAWAEERVLPSVLVERWLTLDQPSRNRLLELAESVKFRSGQFVTTFELLDEMAVREAESIDAILHRPAIRRIVQANGSGPGKARALIYEIRTLRFPRLTRARELLRAEIAAVGLPRGIKVILPKELASDEIRIEIVARGASELSGMLETLSTKAAPLVRIATTLAGGGEV